MGRTQAGALQMFGFLVPLPPGQNGVEVVIEFALLQCLREPAAGDRMVEVNDVDHCCVVADPEQVFEFVQKRFDSQGCLPEAPPIAPAAISAAVVTRVAGWRHPLIVSWGRWIPISCFVWSGLFMALSCFSKDSWAMCSATALPRSGAYFGEDDRSFRLS